MIRCACDVDVMKPFSQLTKPISIINFRGSDCRVHDCLHGVWPFVDKSNCLNWRNLWFLVLSSYRTCIQYVK